MRQIKWWQWILIAIPPIVGVYFIVKTLKKAPIEPKKEDPAKNEQNKNKATAAVAQVSKSCTFPIQKGSKNDCVKVLQNALLDVYVDPLPKYGADGSFGQETINALMFDIKKDIIYSQEDLVATIKLLYQKQAEYVDTRLQAPKTTTDNLYDLLNFGK